MIVITADQRGSRTAGDRIPEVLAILRETLRALPTKPHGRYWEFQRTAGDEIQALFEDGDIELALRAVLKLHWLDFGYMGIGIGSVLGGTNPTINVRQGNGGAYIAARAAIDRAKKLPGGVALEVEEGYREDLDQCRGLVDASLQLLFEEDRKSSPRDRQIAEQHYFYEKTQAKIARELGISQPAVSQSLKKNSWKTKINCLSEIIENIKPKK